MTDKPELKLEDLSQYNIDRTFKYFTDRKQNKIYSRLYKQKILTDFQTYSGKTIIHTRFEDILNFIKKESTRGNKAALQIVVNMLNGQYTEHEVNLLELTSLKLAAPAPKTSGRPRGRPKKVTSHTPEDKTSTARNILRQLTSPNSFKFSSRTRSRVGPSTPSDDDPFDYNSL